MSHTDLVAICNARLFRLHHGRRLKSGKPDHESHEEEQAILSISTDALPTERLHLPYDPVHESVVQAPSDAPAADGVT